MLATLSSLGLRDRVRDRRIERRREARLRAEAAGSDELSRPALHGMDTTLDELIDMDGGFFVEAGANDGYTQSNTYYLERFRGWTGLLVEPMQELYDLCLVERPHSTVMRAALVPFDFEDETVTMHFGDLMSVVEGEHMDSERTAAGTIQGWRDPYEAQVPARTLSSLLDEIGAPEIDLLSLDVEGYEPEVLKGLDLERQAPRWLLVEMHEVEAGRREIESLLGDRYAFQRMLSPLDALYRRSDVPSPGSDS